MTIFFKPIKFKVGKSEESFSSAQRISYNDLSLIKVNFFSPLIFAMISPAAWLWEMCRECLIEE